jgi:hypothetical protein
MRIEVRFYGKTIAKVLRVLKFIGYKPALAWWRTMSHYHYARESMGRKGQPDLIITLGGA